MFFVYDGLDGRLVYGRDSFSLPFSSVNRETVCLSCPWKEIEGVQESIIMVLVTVKVGKI